MKGSHILILEDDQNRADRFKAVIKNIDTSLKVIVWQNAWSMIRDIDEVLQHTVLISLDHDLYIPDENEDDPGDGLDVAKHLAGKPPCCPVIIHSTNVERAQTMFGELELEGWQVKRVAPIGDDWIESHWYGIARELLD
ncbi:MAG: hypothetical protein JW860_10890 [Sedimentisphaerales bacterium]|nr:hypothetical protein [Sedimentisphaerales bacterium]